MIDDTNKLAFLLLAAGGSRRLGQPKQLVLFDGQPLLAKQLDLLMPFNQDIYLVLGSESKQILTAVSHQLSSPLLHIVESCEWDKGIGHSIAAGVKSLAKDISAVVIVLADQWRLAADDIVKLIDCWQQTPNKIAVSTNAIENENKIISPPIIFPKPYFEALSSLTGDTGAKAILKENSENIVSVVMANAFIDLDTPEQLAEIRKVIPQ